MTTAKRNRIIAVVASVITITAIVLAFASGYLGLPWLWLRPAAELLLLAELVGLIVLERHQLFEPVQEQVGHMHARVEEIFSTLGLVREQIGTSGQVALYSNPPEALRAWSRFLNEALARNHQSPQILRTAVLSGAVFTQDPRDIVSELQEAARVVTRGFLRTEESPLDARARFWYVRIAWVISTLDAFDSALEHFRVNYFQLRPLNLELKFAVRPKVEALLSPGLVTDRDVYLSYGNQVGGQSWAVSFHGQQYAAVFARWFDDVWSDIPDTYLVYSRNGLNQKALDLIRSELEIGATTTDHQPT